MSVDYDYLYKVLLVGDSGVGKSSIMLQYTEISFIETFISTIGVDFKMKVIVVAGKKIKLQIWDTAGQERFRTITTAYYRGAHGILIVYDVTNRVSFENISRWQKEIITNTPPEKNPVQFLIANKSDCAPSLRKVSVEDGTRFADNTGIRCVEVSAKTRMGINAIFDAIAYAMFSRQQADMRDASGKTACVPDGSILLQNNNNASFARDTSCC